VTARATVQMFVDTVRLAWRLYAGTGYRLPARTVPEAVAVPASASPVVSDLVPQQGTALSEVG
jgi:hypothetical protein